MPKRKSSKSKDDNKEENDESISFSPCEIPIKRSRGRPKAIRPVDGGNKDKPQDRDQSPETPLSPSAEEKQTRRHDDSKEEEENVETGSEKKEEPEKRSLRATNSRRSREALARHMLEESAAIAAQKSLLDKSIQEKDEQQSDPGTSKEKTEDSVSNDAEDIEKHEPTEPEVEKKEKIELPSTKIVHNYLPQSPTSDGVEEAVKKLMQTPSPESRKPICIEVRERYLSDLPEINETQTKTEPGTTEMTEEKQSDSVDSPNIQTDGAVEPIKSDDAEIEDKQKIQQQITDDKDTPGSAGRTARPRRISHRPGIDFRVGGRLEACDFMSNWYASKIVNLDWNEKEVLIHFEGWSSRFDEWVSMDSHRLRPITRTSARKEHKQKLKEVRNREFKVHENVLAKWVDGKMYPAKVVSVNANGSCQVTFLDDGIQKSVKPMHMSKVTKEEFAYHVSQAKPLDRRGRFGKRKFGSSSDDDESSDNLETKSLKRDDKEVRTKRGFKQAKIDKQSPSQGVNVRRKKLLIGGIFQAKRTFQESQTMKKRASRSRDHEASRPGRKPMRLPGLKVKPGRAKNAKLLTENNSTFEESTPVVDNNDNANEEQRKVGSARKEFIIEEDHNHFKCLFDNCGKAFRKESLLASHMKHYHDNSAKTTRKREVSSSNANTKLPQDTPTIPVEKESDLSDVSPNIEPKAAKTVKKGRGFKHNFAKHKVNIAKRRPMLLYRRKPNDSDVVDKMVETVSPKVKGNKRKPVRKSDLAPVTIAVDENFANMETLVKADPDAPNADQTVVATPSSSPIKKNGRKRKWRCNIRSPKKIDATPVVNDSVEIVKLSPESPDASLMVVDDDCGREEVVNCICRVLEEDGLMMQCETCMAWQHGVCFNIEEEDKVPEKYVCFACKNPSGQRESYRFWYDQDWWKTGQVARFSFTPKDEEKDRKVATSMLKAHALAGNVIAVKKLLHCLEQKLDLARNGSESNLSTWNKVWSLKSSLREKNGGSGDGRQSALHFDHSYSVPSKNGVEVQSDDILSNTPLETEEKVEIADEALVEPAIPTTNGIDKQEATIDVTTVEIIDEKNFQSPDNNYTLFLDHLDHMQDEVDHRLDEISQHIEALEVEWDDDSFSPHGNSLGDLPVVKKMLKVLQVNLDKVLRMATIQLLYYISALSFDFTDPMLREPYNLKIQRRIRNGYRHIREKRNKGEQTYIYRKFLTYKDEKSK
uniref:C2H2-type domain-containing protein n=1 Tax=Strigamia maritima TaxID=126957 RepID=T1IXS7_STRMM